MANSKYTNNSKNIKPVTFLSLQQKILFTSELQTLLSAGISILETIETVKEHSTDNKIVQVCQNLQKQIQNGMTFSQALKCRYSEVFGTVYISIIKAGEESGELDVALERTLLVLKKQDAIKSKVISASIYPLFLILLILVVIFIFSVFVFPRLLSILTMYGGKPTLLTQIIISVLNFIAFFWWVIVIGLVFVVRQVIIMFKNPKIKSKWDNFIIKVPFVSDFIQYANLSNFMTALYVSYEAGIPITLGIELASKTVGNYNLKSRINKSIELVKKGNPVSESFYKTNVIPSILLTIITAGEKSGSMGKKFNEAAEILDKKVDMALNVLMKLFEPTLIVIIGIIVFIIAIVYVQINAGILSTF